jgi:hypothetical protein
VGHKNRILMWAGDMAKLATPPVAALKRSPPQAAFFDDSRKSCAKRCNTPPAS